MSVNGSRGRGLGLGPRWTMLAAALALLGVVLAAPRGGTSERSTPTPIVRAAASVERPTTTSTPRSIEPDRSPMLPAQSASLRAAGTPDGASTVAATPSTTQVAPSVVTTPRSERIETGWLQAPTAISASYQLSAATSTVLTATFTGATPLTFEITCDGASSSMNGSSPLTLTARGASCTATLRGPDSLPATSYSLDLGPR